MRKINTFNMGKYYEAYIVCPAEQEKYFSSLADILQSEKGIRAGVFRYDKDDLTPETQKILKSSQNVIFVLNQGVTERAARDENDLFRKVYSYVGKNNQDSVSLVAVNGCHVGYDIEYPEEMLSFKWLHRKKYDLTEVSAEELADKLYEELRYYYPPSEKKKMEQVAERGIYVCTEIYENLSKLLLWALIMSVLSPLCLIILFFAHMGDLSILLFLIAFAATACSVVLIGVAVGRAVYYNGVLKDVSRLFVRFTNRMLIIASILCGAAVSALAVGLEYLFYTVLIGKATDIAVLIYMFAVFTLFTAVFYAKSVTVKNTLYSSTSFIEYRVERLQKDKIFLIAASAGILICLIGFFAVYFIC